MSKEIELSFRSGESNVYACVFNIAGLVYSFVAAGFVAWNNANIDHYDITLTETGGGKYYGDFPIIGAGDYSVSAYHGTKIFGDTVLGPGHISWDGTSEIKLTVTEIAGKVWDEELTASKHNIATSAGRRLRQLNVPVLLEGTSPNTAGTTNTSIRIELDGDASSIDGTYDPGIISIYEGTGIGQSRMIFEYDGLNKLAYINRDWKVIPDDTSKYIVVANAGDTHVNEGVAAGGGASTITLNALASTVDSVYNEQVVFIVAGTGTDQMGLVTGYVGSTKVATIEHAWAIQPDSTSVYAMLPCGYHTIAEVQAGLASEALQRADKKIDFPAGTLTHYAAGTTDIILQKNLKTPSDVQVSSVENVIAAEEDIP